MQHESASRWVGQVRSTHRHGALWWAARQLLPALLLIVPWLVSGGSPSGAVGLRPSVRVLATVSGGPDDLALGPHGSLYLSVLRAGAVVQILADGRQRVVARGLLAPEGIVLTASGTLLVGEQGRNRVVRVDPRSGLIRSFLEVPNHTGRDGLDGLASDPRDGSLLVPDSAHGRLLRVSADGRQTRVLSGNLGRPVGVALDSRGTPVVVDETLNGAFIVRPGAPPWRLGTFLSVPDDIVSDGAGGFYVTCLGDATLRHVDARGTTTLVASGLPNPQGLVRRGDGSLVVTEEDAGLVLVIHPHL